ncbi:MAG: hypothetical protein JSS02_13575 [Planctomycetes bacterium]|nr:hypothetical protein [Planctomycetota bacterium]
MRPSAVFVWCLLALLSGCSMMNPNSRFNVNQGNYSDEYMIHKEARGTEALDHEDADGLDNWLYSPKHRAINRDLGVD